jgi:LemA protein
MKKILIGSALAIVLFFIFFFGWFMSVNNNLVSLDENVKTKWAQVENVYQRRADLIPNLVSTVKGYAKHEADVLEEVTKARSQVGQVHVDNADDLKKFDQAQGQLSSALSRLLVVSEKYPDLKADKNFLELQSQLEGTENFNEAAQEYNTYLRKFPQSLVAGLRNFQPKAYFEADAGAKNAPKVEF